MENNCMHFVNGQCPLCKHDHMTEFVEIQRRFEQLHPGHYAVPNGECPFAIFYEQQKCPYYEKK